MERHATIKRVILLVEDDPITRKVVRVTLEREGHELVEAGTGQRALELLETIRPDLVLQDLTLPDMDGLELAEQLRARLESPRVPLVAFSGLVPHSDEARLAAVGFDGLIMKPVEPARLVQTIQSCPPPPPVALAADRFGVGKLIVVADDSPQQLRLAAFHLERLGFDVVTAADGLEALERARARKPAAIVSDIMMPLMDGFSLCTEVRRDPDLCNVPVILVTAVYVGKADQIFARKAGATEIIIRTPNLREVVVALRAALG